jgi:dienelactone hydrolase
VIAPNRMGYSKSGGRYIEGCEMTSMGQTWADDVVAAIDYARKLPYVDASRIVLVGQSQGGFVSVALGSRNLPGVLGIIDFAGGMRNDNCVAWEQSVINAFGTYGKTSRVPALFFYGDNDSYFAQPLPHQFLKAYNDAGGHATMIEVGVWKDNSHLLFHKYDGTQVWIPPVEKFLAGLGLPYQVSAKPESSSGLPDVEDVFALSEIVHEKQSIVEGYEHFLWHSPPKAFAISPDGHYGSSSGENAQHDAINLCESHTKMICSLYAVDDKVVYRKAGP